MVSIIIACHREKYLKRTLTNLLETAAGDVEIILTFDGHRQRAIADNRIKVLFDPELRGRRIAINEAVQHAQGEHLYHVDAHCRLLTDGWDVKLREACGANAVAVSSILNLRPNKQHLIRHVLHDPRHLANAFWDEKIPQANIEEALTMTGCSYMMHRDLWKPLDERYSGWGYMGIELSLRGWLCGDVPTPLLLRSDVICEHMGRRHAHRLNRTQWIGDLFSPARTLRHIGRMYRNNQAVDQQRSLQWLIDKFAPVPGWHDN